MGTLSRREFLKFSALSAGALAFRSLDDWFLDGEGFPSDVLGVGRVGVEEIEVYAQPDYGSEPIGKLYRDQLFPIFEELIDPDALPNAPRWYRSFRGYVHSAHVQRVDGRHLNNPVPWVPEEGWLGEVTVPFTRSFRLTQIYGWVPLYRLYYQSVHWVTAVEEGKDGKPWYRLTDELLHIDYYIPATHMRIVSPEELTPISPEVPFEAKRIEVSIDEQTLTAYEYDEVVLHTLVSTGIPSLGLTSNGIPTATPRGRFNIQVKMPSKHMGDGRMTDDINAYELPGVPWVAFFESTGVAFHGTYWHHNFGRKMSHGCVNMTVEEAKWLFRWTLPEYESGVDVRGYGTQVIVA